MLYRDDCKFCKQRTPDLEKIESEQGIPVLKIEDNGSVPAFVLVKDRKPYKLLRNTKDDTVLKSIVDGLKEEPNEADIVESVPKLMENIEALRKKRMAELEIQPLKARALDLQYEIKSIKDQAEAKLAPLVKELEDLLRRVYG